MSVAPEVESQTAEDKPKINIKTFMRDFRNYTNFREFDDDLVVIEDPIGFKRVLPDGTVEVYMDKMRKDREEGRNEAVSWGVGNIGKNRFVELVFNWEFMAGTSGVVVGEKFMRATQYAAAENLPIIIACASGGQRQQEASPALREMERTTLALSQFKQKTNQPLIFILVGNVWGGITASAVPMADEVIGMAGTNFGFAGPRLIKTFQKGIAPSPDSQTVENSYKSNRKVHIIINDQTQLLDHLEKTLKLVASTNRPFQKPKRLRELSALDFDHPKGYSGYFIPTRPDRVLRSHSRKDVRGFIKVKPQREPIWEQHQILKSDPRRPDTLYLLQNAFDGFVPLFSGRITDEKDGRHLKFPAIVAALAYVDDSQLPDRVIRMVIGNQPSYIRLRDGSVVIDQDNSNPTAWDYQYELAAIKYAARLRLQITSFANTLGARPTEEEEQAAQFDGIASCLEAQVNFPYFTSGYLIGIGGSGGYLATNFTADYAAMLSGTQEYVAVPQSAADILYKDHTTADDIIRTAVGMKPTASFLEERELVDWVIQEPDEGAQNNPLATARALREDIIRVELEYGHQTPEEILKRRIQRVIGSQPILMGHLSGKSVEHSRSRLDRFLHR